MKGKSTASLNDQKDKTSKKPAKQPASEAENLSVADGKQVATISDQSVSGSKATSKKNKFSVNQKSKDEHEEDIQDDHKSISNLKLDKDDIEKLGKNNFVDSVGQDTKGMIDDLGEQKTREVWVL